MNPGRLVVWLTMAVVVLSMGAVSPSVAQTAGDDVPVFHEMTPGSFLVFPLFDVRAPDPDGNTWATQLRITSTSGSPKVQLNFVCPGNLADNFCDGQDQHIALTEYMTKRIDVGDITPPCDQGYVVAFVENGNKEGVAQDSLIGSYHITRTTAAGVTSVEAAPAIAIQSAKAEGENLGADGALQFGGVFEDDPDYKALPSRLFTDFRAVTPGVAGSHLILLTLDVAVGAYNPVTVVDIDFWAEDETPYSTSWRFVCWERVRLDAIDPNFLEAFLGSPTGALAVTGVPSCPIPGACPPLLPVDPTVLGAINEFGPLAGSLTKRNLFHDKVPKSTVFFPR